MGRGGKVRRGPDPRISVNTGLRILETLDFRGRVVVGFVDTLELFAR